MIKVSVEGIATVYYQRNKWWAGSWTIKYIFATEEKAQNYINEVIRLSILSKESPKIAKQYLYP